MARFLSVPDVLVLIEDRVADAGSQAAAADALGVSGPYLSDVLAGRRQPGPKLLEPLGLVARVVYVKREEG